MEKNVTANLFDFIFFDIAVVKQDLSNSVFNVREPECFYYFAQTLRIFSPIIKYLVSTSFKAELA